MGLLTGLALTARSEAERQRGEAEGLVDFMLTDLRGRLRGVGRLDVMSAVNRRALAYYADQDLSRLPPASLGRRARLLHAVGEDEETRGEHDAALAQFREARRTTSALLAAAPDDPERIFDQAQSEFWIGYVDYARGRWKAARPPFEAYQRLSERLVAVRPENPKYLREAGYAEGNLCSLDLQPPADAKAALRTCAAALDRMQRAARRLPPDSDIIDDVINRHAWMADAWFAAADLARARAERLEQQRLLDGRVAADPKNMRLKSVQVNLELALARLEEAEGRKAAARRRLLNALDTQSSMVRFDPSNKDWVEQKEWITRKLSTSDKSNPKDLRNERPVPPELAPDDARAE
jgi:hypothetical protein